MKKFLLGSVALAALGIGAPAIAADMGVRHYAAPAPAFSWTGCHIGGLVGYEWGRHRGYSTDGSSSPVVLLGPPGAAPLATTAIAPGTAITSNFDMDGFLGGGDLGCDYQFGAWVVGAEVDWESVNKEGQSRFVPGTSAFASGVGFAPVTVGTTTFTGFGANNFMSSKERWLATARVRLGYAVDRWMFYATGGAAWAKIDTEFFCLGGGVAPFNCASEQHDRRTGYTVGAGVEYAPAVLKGNWTIRAEYLYVDIRSYNTLTSPSTVTGTSGNAIPFNVNSGRLENHQVRFGLAYKFGNWAYAAPAVYK